MVDNNSTIYVQNDLVYNVPSIAVVSNGSEVFNVIQPELQNAIYLTPDQFQSLGIQINDNLQIADSVQINSTEKPNILLNSTPNINPVKVQKFKSVLICNQNNQSEINSSPKIPIVKKIITKNVAKPKETKKIVYRIIQPDNFNKNKNLTPQLMKINDKLITNVKSNDYLKKNVINNVIKNDNINQNDIIDEDTLTLKSVRTRFGRITKPPKHLKREIKKDIGETQQMHTEPEKIEEKLTVSENQQTESEKPIPIHQKRKIASTKFRCKTCHRFYLGRAKMKKHLKLNPDHKVPNKYESDNQLWLDLLDRTYNAPKNEQVSTFIGELSHILEKVKSLVPKGIKPVVNENDVNSFKIDNMLSNLLGVSEGKYILDIDVLNSSNINQNDKLVCEDNILNSIDTLMDDKNLNDSENSAQTSLLNLLDTGQVHFDNELANSSEAVRCVDQLVNERLKTLTDELNPLLSSNLSSNITLDLSMDMFSYTS